MKVFSDVCDFLVRINSGKTQVWNAAGRKPLVCEAMDRIAQVQNPEAKVWRGSEVPVDRQGVKVLGAPIGHPVFVAAQLSAVAEHPLMPDLQSAWLLLLHCAGARATYFLRVVNPEAALDYATLHDERMWSCLCRLLDMSPNLCDCVAKQCATLPLVLGGLGLRSAVRTRLPAHWASWADCLPMIKESHPEVAVEGLQRVDTTECLRAVARAAEELSRLPGFVLPSWEALANGARPPVREPDQHEPGCQRAGWQHEGSARLEEAVRESLFVTMTDCERALVRSQGGPGAGAAYTACPKCSITRIDPHLFRTLLLRRLRLPLPLSKRTCRCGRPLDSRGHHRAACARAGEARLRCRECCRQDLQRRGSKNGDEHDGPRHGLGCAEPE